MEFIAGHMKEGEEDGRAAECSFSFPTGMAVDEATHSCFVADKNNHSIKKISFVD